MRRENVANIAVEDALYEVASMVREVTLARLRIICVSFWSHDQVNESGLLLRQALLQPRLDIGALRDGMLKLQVADEFGGVARAGIDRNANIVVSVG